MVVLVVVEVGGKREEVVMVGGRSEVEVVVVV